eukprot:CAMPEP_0204292626 /NCGR_PEP_ID=MMETSP0468-20130131/64703_1 /ASSEMBLY_ACC=CAM_ASM_000383 /TAXON_ID=2969 /ORGANISM="Oxyrrhis marina" /LENGTH=83 /DNA_ID=CAMNT_0051271029 /DNA_START=158 /DNA_END=409 /DNA_ORIENTATION=+
MSPGWAGPGAGFGTGDEGATWKRVNSVRMSFIRLQTSSASTLHPGSGWDMASSKLALRGSRARSQSGSSRRKVNLEIDATRSA